MVRCCIFQMTGGNGEENFLTFSSIGSSRSRLERDIRVEFLPLITAW